MSEFFKREIAPQEFAKVIDEAQYLIGQFCAIEPEKISSVNIPPDEIMYYLHKFRDVCNES